MTSQPANLTEVFFQLETDGWKRCGWGGHGAFFPLPCRILCLVGCHAGRMWLHSCWLFELFSRLFWGISMSRCWGAISTDLMGDPIVETEWHPPTTIPTHGNRCSHTETKRTSCSSLAERKCTPELCVTLYDCHLFSYCAGLKKKIKKVKLPVPARWPCAVGSWCSSVWVPSPRRSPVWRTNLHVNSVVLLSHEEHRQRGATNATNVVFRWTPTTSRVSWSNRRTLWRCCSAAFSVLPVWRAVPSCSNGTRVSPRSGRRTWWWYLQIHAALW